MDPDEVYLCHQCGKVFYKLSTLESHAKWKHMEKTNDFMCDQCGRTFQKKYNLIKHLDSGYHDVTETVNCALCNFRAQNRKFMGEHYQKFHEIRLSETNVYFKNPAEFFSWKNEFENKTRSRFVKMSSTRKRKNGFMRSTYFCHRDGNFIPKGRNLRHLKRMGSNKINAHCPAKMDVDFGENIVVVTYVDTHLGHELDITRMNLDLTDRALIAKKLASKVPFETILEEINSSPQENDLKRVNLLTRKDLWNIVDTFKINPKTVVYSKTRVRRKKKMDRPKKEPRKNRVFYKVIQQDSNSSVDDCKVVYNMNDEENYGDSPVISVSQVEEENVIMCPIVLKDEDNEYVQEFTVIGNEIDGDTSTCLIINAQGELESISGHRVIFTEDGVMEICENPVLDEDDGNRENVVAATETGGELGEISALNEDETDGRDYSPEGGTGFCETENAKTTNSIFEIPAAQEEISLRELIMEDNKDAVLKRKFVQDNVSEYSVNRKQQKIKLLKEEEPGDYAVNNTFEEVNEQPSFLPVEELTVEHQPEYEVTIENFEDGDVNEFVIVSTNEEGLNECTVIPNENYADQDFDQTHHPLPLETVIVKGIKEEPVIKEEVVDTVVEEECVEVCEEVEPKWNKKRKQVLHQILNVHNMINNEQQLNVFSRNISSLENVLKALNKNDETVPQSSDYRLLNNKIDQMDS